MTADIRTAAQREAERKHLPKIEGSYATISQLREVDAFTQGAVWAAERVTPTREQIAEALRHGGVELGYVGGHNLRLHAADAVLALMKDLTEGGRDGNGS